MTRIDPGLPRISSVSGRSYDLLLLSPLSMITRSANSLGNAHISDGRFLAGRRSSALSIRSDEKQSAPRVIHAELGDHPERCPKFRDISTRAAAAALRNVLACGSRGAGDTAYAVHRLRALFVRVIIVALFDSNLVLGVICIDLLSSHRLLFGDCGHVCAFAPGAICEPRVCSLFIYTWFTYQSGDLRVPSAEMSNVLVRVRRSRRDIIYLRADAWRTPFRFSSSPREYPPLTQAA